MESVGGKLLKKISRMGRFFAKPAAGFMLKAGG